MDAHAESPQETTGPGDNRFSLAQHGGVIELTLRGKANAGEILNSLNEMPVDTVACAAVFAAIRDGHSTPVTVGEIQLPADAEWSVKISPSRMSAYLVPCHADDGESEPPIVTEQQIRTALTQSGVNYGILESAIQELAAGKPLTQFVLVAHGEQPRQGQQAEIEFTFDSTPSIVPSQNGDEAVDFRAMMGPQYVESGTLLARHHDPIAGKSGHDVKGAEIPPQPVRDRPLSKHQGRGTTIVGDELRAAAPGRPHLTNEERVEVLQVFDVGGDVDFSVGNIDFVGDVTIKGDVHPGFSVHATGSVTVRGIIDHAVVIAGGDVIAVGIAGSAVGDTSCRIEAGKGIAAHYLHNVSATAGGLVKIQREILNSNVDAERVEVAGPGRIVGGRVAARTEVTCGVLGSIQATGTWVEAGPITAGKQPVVRGTKAVHAGVTVGIGHGIFQVEEDMHGSSFWAFEGEIVRMEGGSTGPSKP